MDPSASIIIGTINVFCPIFQFVLIVFQSRYLFYVSFQNQVIINGTCDINYQSFFSILLRNHIIWLLMFYLPIHFNTDLPQNFQYPFQLQTQLYASTSFHILLLNASFIRLKGCSKIPYRVFSCTLSVLTYWNQPLTMCRTFSTCVPHNLHLFEKTL